MIGIPMYLRLARLIWTLQGLNLSKVTWSVKIATVGARIPFQTAFVIAHATIVFATGMDQVDQINQIIHRNDS